VERVLDELLDHAGRPLDDLSRGDLVGEVVRQEADLAHGSSAPSASRAASSKYAFVLLRVSASAPSASGPRSKSTSLRRAPEQSIPGTRKASRSGASMGSASAARRTASIHVARTLRVSA